MARLPAAGRAMLADYTAYQTHSGPVVGVRQMPAAHLINALLAALREGEPTRVTRMLAAEVKRRGLEEQAMRVAAERMAKILTAGAGLQRRAAPRKQRPRR